MVAVNLTLEELEMLLNWAECSEEYSPSLPFSHDEHVLHHRIKHFAAKEHQARADELSKGGL